MKQEDEGQEIQKNSCSEFSFWLLSGVISYSLTLKLHFVFQSMYLPRLYHNFRDDIAKVKIACNKWPSSTPHDHQY